MTDDEQDQPQEDYSFALESGELDKVIRHTQHHGKSRAKSVNGQPVKSYLNAGMNLVRKILGPGATPPETSDGLAHDRPHLLAWLTQREVAKELVNNPPSLHRQGSDSSLRGIWGAQANYIADLLSFGLWSQHYRGQYQEKINVLADQLMNGSDLPDAVHELCYWDMLTMIDKSVFRLQLVASVVAEQDERIAAVLAQSYNDFIETWQPVHEAAFRNNGLRLRPGVNLNDVAYMATALAEGLALRAVAQPDAPVIDREHHRTLYGTACLALLYAFTEPGNAADSSTLEEAVQHLINRAQEKPSG